MIIEYVRKESSTTLVMSASVVVPWDLLRDIRTPRFGYIHGHSLTIAIVRQSR